MAVKLISTSIAGGAATQAAKDAKASADLAKKWATEQEDVPVAGGEFSAYHWAQKAEEGIASGVAMSSHISAIDPHPAMRNIVNQSNYDVHWNHSLDGTYGDVAKIHAAIAVAPIGAKLHFPAMTGVYNTPILIDRQHDWEFHGTTINGVMASNTLDFLTVNIPNANSVGGGGVRAMNFHGLNSNLSIGRNLLNLISVPGAAVLQSTFEDIVAWVHPTNTAGYCFKISDEGQHWCKLQYSFLQTRGVHHKGADGWKFKNVGVSGKMGFLFEITGGAHQTLVEGCTGAMDGLAWQINTAQKIIFTHNSWEVSGAYDVVANPFGAQAYITNGAAATQGIQIIRDNYGGGTNILAPLRIAGGGLGVRDTFIDGCTFSAGLTSYDVQIFGNAIGTRFGRNFARGTRAGVDTVRPLSVFDNGIETQGIWKPASVLTPSNGWTVGSGAEVMVDSFTAQLIGRHVLTAGTLTAGTIIANLPVGMRGKHKVRRAVATTDNLTRDVIIETNGDVVLGAAFSGTELDLAALLSGLPVIATTTYDGAP